MKHDEAIISKITKMLALAKGTNNPEEAAAVMGKAQAMMVKHEIELIDLEGNVKSDIAEEGFDFHGSPYARRIIGAVARLNRCAYAYGKSGRTVTHYIYGLDHHRAVVIEMSKWLIAETKRQAADAKRKQTYPEKNFVGSFQNGAAVEITRRVDALVEVTKKGGLVDETTGTNLPAVIDFDNQLNAAKEFMMPLVGKPKRSSIRANSAAGYTAGRAFGQSVNLGPQLGTSGSAKALK